MKELVYDNGNRSPITNSLLVAEKFNKEHQHVLRDIRALIEGMSKIGETPLFAETTYVHQQNGQIYPMYAMNRDGFTLLAMGFTGKRAMKFKIEYINAFNAMEKKINEATQKPLTAAQMFALQAQVNIELESKVNSLEGRVASIIQKQEDAETELKQLPLSVREVPELKLKDKIRMMVNRYSQSVGIHQQYVWDMVYQTLYYNYQVSVKGCKKIKKSESWLDVAERKGYLDYIHAVISNLLREKGVANDL